MQQTDLAIFDSYRASFEEFLPQTLPKIEGLPEEMLAMMAYSLGSGGKRVRPLLCMEFCRLCGGEPANALYFAAAIEYIHTYSLIHDDLPCMDNDDIRRGKPTSHKKYGEANALLTGDALLTHSFFLAAAAIRRDCVTKDAGIRATALLAESAGLCGMIGGQYIDLKTEGLSVGVDVLTRMDLLKTGALIRTAAVLGCLAANASEKEIAAAEAFADNLGLAFQIIDDLLDANDSTSSDAVNKKSTYPGVLGLQAATELAQEYTSRAIDALAIFGENADALRSFSAALLGRRE